MTTHNFTTAKDLLEFLNPLRPEWGTGLLFRSQFELDDAGYKLLPTLFRPYQPNSLAKKYYDKSFDILGHGGSKENNIRFQNLYSAENQIYQEAMAISYTEQLILKDFVEKSNDLGIHVPESDRMLNRELKNNEFVNPTNLYQLGLERQSDNSFKPPRNIDEIYLKKLNDIEKERPPLFAGLAQHHGAVTRLLDFSLNAYKSLFHPTNNHKAKQYFQEKKEGYIAIYWFPDWYFKIQFLTECTRRMLYERRFIVPTYQLVKMPSSSNHYLFQQEALFAYAAFPYDYKLLYGEFPSVNDFLSSFSYDDRHPLQRARIPISEFENLQSMLRKIGIIKSRLMPNLDNVIEDMRSN